MNRGWLNAAEAGASGSEFRTSGKIRSGRREIEVDDAGDFQVGQWVEVSGCNLHFYGTVYNDKEPYFARNQKPLETELELRGLDCDKTWQTFVLHFDATELVTWRWMAVDPKFQTATYDQPVLRREWSWQGENLPVEDDWVSLTDGVDVRLGKRDWLPGQSVSFHARNRLLTRIAGIRGRTLILENAATRDAEGAIVRHHDQAALQAAVDRAIAERKGLFLPAGRYRLSQGLWVRNASLRIEGADREHVTLDVSGDHTAALWLAGGREVAVRNLGIVGHSGFLELPSYTHFRTATGYPFWPTANQQMEIKGCAAVNAVGTESLIFEDLKVSRMASEAFYLHGSERYGLPPYIQAPHEGMPELQRQYTRSCVYQRCHVSDCGFNAFNNNDHGENTSILHCHVERVTNFCEQASRFTRIIGNYVKDGCAAGIHGGRIVPAKVGPTQAVVSDNVFEAGVLAGGISIANHATQVILANNLFVGYSKESAVFVLGGRRVIVTGNHIDLTCLEGNPDNERCGICIEASNVTVGGNHIYVRGGLSENVTGIHVADDAVDIHIYDNIIENCMVGVRSGRRVYQQGEKPWFQFRHTECEVAETTGPRSFRTPDLPPRCDDPRPYVGWHIRWLAGPLAGKNSEIESFNAEQQEVTIKVETALQKGFRFAVYPRNCNWQIHHNTFLNCREAGRIKLLSDRGLRFKDNAESGEGVESPALEA